MFVYKENNHRMPIQRRQSFGGDSQQLEVNTEGSHNTGQKEKQAVGYGKGIAKHCGQPFPTFDVKIIAGRRVVIYHNTAQKKIQDKCYNKV